MAVLLALVLAAGVGGAVPSDDPAPSSDATPAAQQTVPDEQNSGDDQQSTDEEARKAAVEAAIRDAKFKGEITVTAQKREQNVQDVPISIVALSGERLEKQGIQDVQNLRDQVAGLEIVNVQPGSNAFASRGVTAISGSIETNSVVGYYVDEIPVSASGQGPEFALWDVERVEMLRGPQGTLFGEGSMAGTLRIITNKPDVTQFSARVGADLSSTTDGSTNGTLRALVNIPVIEDRLALRITAGYIDDSGWIDIPGLDEKNANTREQLDLRLAARWVPTDRLILDAVYSTQELDLGAEFTATTPYRLLPSEQLPSAGPAGFLTPTDTTNQSANVTLEYDLGWASLVSATSYFDYTSDWLVDLTPFVPLFFGPQTGGVGLNTPHAESTLWAQEIRLSSSGSQQLAWTAGVFYKDSDRLDQRNFQFFLEDAFGIPDFDLTDLYSTVENSKSTSYSVFGEVDYAVSETVSAQVGLRYYSDEREYSILYPLDSLIFGSVAGTRIDASGEDTDFAPKFSLSWKAADSVMLFAKISKGFKSGGTNYNSGISDEVPDDFDSEELWAYEIGAKTNLSASVIANVGVYYNDWTDLQLGFITPDGLFLYTANAGAARSQGGELELIGSVPGTGLSGTVAVAYTDAEITEDVVNAFGEVVAEAGNKIPLTPEWSYNVSASYSVPVGPRWVGVITTSWTNTTETFSGADNAPYQVNSNYDKLNLSLGVMNDRWSLNLYADNLFNSDSTTFAYNRVVAVPLTWFNFIRPRTVGIRYDVRF
jgi:outer membrane receptor protein involved in Fe transport